MLISENWKGIKLININIKYNINMKFNVIKWRGYILENLKSKISYYVYNLFHLNCLFKHLKFALLTI